MWTENLKALKAHLRKGMLYVEMGHAKQQRDNLINRPRRNPHFNAIEDNPIGWVLGRPSGPSHGGLGNSEGPQATGSGSLRAYLNSPRRVVIKMNNYSATPHQRQKTR